MTVQRQIDQLITYRASEWVEVLRTGGRAEREAFVDWLRESRRHVAEFLTMVALDRELNGIDLKGVVDRDTLLKRVSPCVTGLRAESGNGMQRRLRHPSSRRTRQGWLAALAASIAVITLMLVFKLNDFSPARDFTTEAGEQRAIELSDGSTVLLNSESHLQALVNNSTRDLQLLSGEALFKVARDPHRAFRVRTREAVVQALGTQFNVNTRKAGTIVSVLEGKVQVSTPDEQMSQVSRAKDQAALAAGEEARVDANGTINRHDRANVKGAAAWRQRRLVFQRTPIEDVARKFNQHNVSPKLRLEGIEAGSRHYSAIFDADDPGSFADFLAREQDLTIEKRGDELIIRPR